MIYLNILLISCALVLTSAQRFDVSTSDFNFGNRRTTGGYGLLKPGYTTVYPGGYGNGYNAGYGGYNTGYGGYNAGSGGYGNYGGGYGGYPGGQGGSGFGAGYPGQSGYTGGFGGGYDGYPGYGGINGPVPPNFGGYRPNNRPGYDYRPGSNYPGANVGYPGINRPGYNQYRPGFDRPYPGNHGNYFGGYGDGYNDNFRLLGRKVNDSTKKSDTSSA